MNFTVFSPDEMRAHYAQASNKREALKVLAECTCSTTKEVAKLLGVSEKRRGRYGLKISQEQLYKLFEEGLPVRQIAEEAGVSHTTIHDWKKRWMVEREQDGR